MASIGLDNPSTSIEDRAKEDTNMYDQNSGSQLVTTPIENNVATLITLGKHVITPRQGKIWEYKEKFPL